MNWLYDRADDVREFFYSIGVPLLTVIVLCGGLICGIHYLTTESPQQTQAVYDAWCRVNNRRDISLDEWKTLRRNYLLPGMEAKRAADAEAAAIAIGVAAASAASR